MIKDNVNVNDRFNSLLEHIENELEAIHGVHIPFCLNVDLMPAGGTQDFGGNLAPNHAIRLMLANMAELVEVIEADENSKHRITEQLIAVDQQMDEL